MERLTRRKGGHLSSCEEELRGGKPMWALAALNSSDRSRAADYQAIPYVGAPDIICLRKNVSSQHLDVEI